MQNKKGLALLELVVAVAIVLIFAAIIIWLVSVVMQKSKVVSAKAQITQLALLLESVKDDTGYYPTSLQDLTKKEAPKFQEKGWMGFYTEEIPLDPWVNAYFYYIPPTTVLPATRSKPRTTPPSVERIVFNASPGKGRLIITNYRTTANRIWLNGREVVHPSELKNHPVPQIIEKEVDLQENNVFELRLTGQHSSYLFLEVSGFMPTDEYFILGSYGKNKVSGGEGFDGDIAWYSNKYPNFQ